MSENSPEISVGGAPKRRRRRRSRRTSGQGRDQAQNTSSTQSQDHAQSKPATQKKTVAASDTSEQKKDHQSSGGSQRKRRRRGRGRGRGNGEKVQANTATHNNAAHSGEDAPTEGKKQQSGANKTGSKKRSNQRSSRSSQRKRPNQGKLNGRPQGKGNHKGRPNSRQSHTRMETSNETSAGGLVVSGLAEAVSDTGDVDLSRIYVALIGRLDRRGRLLWSMPKGHVEPGEAKSSTAEREVWEETGIHGEVFAELGVIDYWFVSEGRRIHKTVHHHLLRYVDGDLNDEDPEVTEVSWIPVNQLIEHLAFADERKLARQAHDLLPDYARREKAEGRATPR